MGGFGCRIYGFGGLGFRALGVEGLGFRVRAQSRILGSGSTQQPCLSVRDAQREEPKPLQPLNPKPENPSTLNPKPQTLNPKP